MDSFKVKGIFNLKYLKRIGSHYGRLKCGAWRVETAASPCKARSALGAVGGPLGAGCGGPAAAAALGTQAGMLPPCSVSKASACSAGDLGSTPGMGRAPGEEMAARSSVLAWRVPWTGRPGGLQSMGSQELDTT